MLTDESSPAEPPLPTTTGNAVVPGVGRPSDSSDPDVVNSAGVDCVSAVLLAVEVDVLGPPDPVDALVTGAVVFLRMTALGPSRGPLLSTPRMPAPTPPPTASPAVPRRRGP